MSDDDSSRSGEENGTFSGSAEEMSHQSYNLRPRKSNQSSDGNEESIAENENEVEMDPDPDPVRQPRKTTTRLQQPPVYILTNLNKIKTEHDYNPIVAVKQEPVTDEEQGQREEPVPESEQNIESTPVNQLQNENPDISDLDNPGETEQVPEPNQENSMSDTESRRESLLTHIHQEESRDPKGEQQEQQPSEPGPSSRLKRGREERNREKFPSPDNNYNNDNNIEDERHDNKKRRPEASFLDNNRIKNNNQKQDYSEQEEEQQQQKEIYRGFDDDLSDNKTERASLLNIFGGGKLPSVSIPKRQPVEESFIPKFPNKAHYNKHDEEDEVKYIEEHKKLHKNAIPVHQNDETDSEEEQEKTPETIQQVRHYNAKLKVFEKYNFEKRSVDMTSLAIFQQRPKIISAIEQNRVVIIDGFTGCGKTTQVPQFILDRHCELKQRCNVVVTQPRKLAALSVAKRVCEERCWEIGDLVGYQVGMEKKTSPDTLITYVTTGVLLKQLIAIKSLKKWTHIIIDEVHERDLDTDLLLLFIKKILLDDVNGREKHVKIILMSATLNAKKFSEYFVTQQNGRDDVTFTPLIKIPSFRRFTVEEVFLDRFLDDSQMQEISANIEFDKAVILPEIYSHTIQTIVNFDVMERTATSDPRVKKGKCDTKISDRGSVLVFLPGLVEIKTMMKLLEDENNRNERETGEDFMWDIVPLHSSITNEEQTKVFAQPKAFRRKIILSTNIAESSITVSDIVYVIDFCLTKSLCVDSQTNFSCLRTVWASVNQCIQRDGKVYRMVPKEFFVQTMEQEATPEMLRAALEYVVLQVKVLDMGSAKEILSLALDPPQVSGIERAVANLKEVGALTVFGTNERNNRYYDTCDGDLTFMGEIMSSLPISPKCTRLIMLGHCFGVLKEAIIIAAGLSGKSPFATPFNKQLDSYLRRLKWSNKSYSDCFAILYAYRAWQRRHSVFRQYTGFNFMRQEKNWGIQHSLQITQLK